MTEYIIGLFFGATGVLLLLIPRLGLLLVALAAIYYLVRYDARRQARERAERISPVEGRRR